MEANSSKTAGTAGVQDPLAAAMEAYQRGEMQAFERLWGALAGEMRGYLRALARDAAVADDLLQETFLQLHRVRHTYQPPRPVRPWVYAIARNVFLMHRRAAFRRSRHENVAEEELPDVAAPASADTLGDSETVRTALARLPRSRREPVVLHHIMGLSFKEVGAVLGISEGAAKLRAFRGLAELRAIMGVSGGNS
ncbi:MAG: RNA polymerase sigma factor [Thermoanaerobaculales bacterium]